MRWLRDRLDRIAPTFEKGGRLAPLASAVGGDGHVLLFATIGDNDRRRTCATRST